MGCSSSKPSQLPVPPSAPLANPPSVEKQAPLQVVASNAAPPSRTGPTNVVDVGSAPPAGWEAKVLAGTADQPFPPVFCELALF
jgi:hypothetical protein